MLKQILLNFYWFIEFSDTAKAVGLVIITACLGSKANCIAIPKRCDRWSFFCLYRGLLRVLHAFEEREFFLWYKYNATLIQTFDRALAIEVFRTQFYWDTCAITRCDWLAECRFSWLRCFRNMTPACRMVWLSCRTNLFSFNITILRLVTIVNVDAWKDWSAFIIIIYDET